MASRIRAFPIVGHRGAPVAVPPGNTLDSLRRAVEMGAGAVSVNVRCTRDDILVAYHEAIRMLDGEETPLREHSFARWQSYAADTELPLLPLRDVFAWARGAHVGLMLDFQEPGTEAVVARAVRQSGLPMSHVLICGADSASRHLFRSLDPRIPLSQTLLAEQAHFVTPGLLSTLDTDAVTWHSRLLSPAIVKVLRLREIAVYGWEVDLRDEMTRLRSTCAVDGIVTNLPDLLHSLP